MVHIVDDWVRFEEYAENIKRGFYREIREMDDMVRIRIIAGKLGFEKVLGKDSQELAMMRAFMKFHDFMRIERSENADYFLR